MEFVPTIQGSIGAHKGQHVFVVFSGMDMRAQVDTVVQACLGDYDLDSPLPQTNAAVPLGLRFEGMQGLAVDATATTMSRIQ
jgi:hypothetical protein